MNLRPSGYEAPDEGFQIASESTNPSQSLDSTTGDVASLIQAASSEPKDFGQPVVNDLSLTPAQAAIRFHIPEYLLRKACTEGHLEHQRVVNALWISPAAVAVFARAWWAKKGRNS